MTCFMVVNGMDVSGNSDTKDVCGDYPGVFSLDFAEIMDDRHEDNKANANPQTLYP